MQSIHINIPNFISICRILLAIIIIFLLFQPEQSLRIIAFIMSLIIIPLDALDGYLARKLKQETKSGAFLDIISDRFVESIFWLGFAFLGLVSIVVPLIIIIRGILTDSIRNIALKKGYEPFKMMKSKFSTWLVASRFNRFIYAFLKATVFPWLILDLIWFSSPNWFSIIGNILVLAAVSYCLLRGLPVIWDAQYLFTNKAQK